MQAELQHADPYADPHDAIGAQLRDIAPRIAHDPSEFGVTPAASPEPVHAPSLQDISLKDSPLEDSPLKDMPLKDMPLNDNVSDFHDLTPRAGTGRGVALIVCAGIAAATAWYAYGDEAKQRLFNFSHLVPQFLAGAPAQNASAADTVDSQPAAGPAPAQEAATPAQPATALTPPAVEAPPAQAALQPELAQSIETMTREIASLKQTVEQLQAGQQQLGRDVAKVSEHDAQHKPVVRAAKPTAAKPAPRPQRAAATGAPPRNLGTLTPYSPSPAYSQGRTYPQGQAYPQGTAQRDAYIPPPAPTQLPPQPGDTSVPRPPMPLR